MQRTLSDYGFGGKLGRLKVSRYNSSLPFGEVGVQSPLTVIGGEKIRIHEVALWLVSYYKEPPAVILDPTCGKDNRMFSPWIKSGVLAEMGYTYISGDIKGYGDVALDVFKLPVRDSSIDVVVYDPPYTPDARIDERGESYGITEERCIDEIARFFSEDVFMEFDRVLKRRGVVIVKGMDFYYPRNSDNLHLFLGLTRFHKYFRAIALYIYRYFYGNIPLHRYRMRHWRRPVMCHTYFLVLRKRNEPIEVF
ncbi:MAG: hypothetical protein DRJ03_16725 [Chloroflexi bacterium]|nr:MAG: hypothetical protein DRJ03_16725 [Chloroflexota bacterium]